MTGALIILAVTVAFGLLLFCFHNKERLHHHDHHTPAETPSADASVATFIEDDDNGNKEEGEVCCGLHAVCEKFTPIPGQPPVYFDDEELDSYIGREEDSYNDAEIEQFREVMLTMLPSEIPDWLKSLKTRHIVLPIQLRDEVMLLLS